MFWVGLFSSYTPEHKTFILPLEIADRGFLPTIKFPEKSAKGTKSSL